MKESGIYFDYAAATPMSETVVSAIQPFFTSQFHNPSAEYGPARDARDALGIARASVAEVIGAKPGEIIFTAGGTEANNLAIEGVMKMYPGANMILSAIEHESVLKPAENHTHRIVTTGKLGRIDPSQIEANIDDKTVLVSVMYANNEIGTIQPIRKIALLMEKIRKQRNKSGNTLPLYLHSDGAQAGNYLDLHVHRLGVDLLSLNGGKIYGPKQSGALYIRSGITLQPLIYGGGQEKGLRSGTQNVAGSIGFATALKDAQTARVDEQLRLSELSKYMIENLETMSQRISLNGSKKHRLPNNIHLTITDYDNERLQIELDQQGIYVAVGSACSASTQTPSHVLKAIGMTDADIRSSLRLTLGRGTNQRQIDSFLAVLAKLI